MLMVDATSSTVPVAWPEPRQGAYRPAPLSTAKEQYDPVIFHASNPSAKEPVLAADPNYQCDEYPFGSTYQGAASGGPFSTKEIPTGANERSGLFLGQFYSVFRILDGDNFWVEVRDVP